MAVNENHEAAARLFDVAADELARAARHCRTAAAHMRAGEVPPGGAHAWAAPGHLDVAEERLRERARMHVRRSKT